MSYYRLDDDHVAEMLELSRARSAHGSAGESTADDRTIDGATP